MDVLQNPFSWWEWEEYSVGYDRTWKESYFSQTSQFIIMSQLHREQWSAWDWIMSWCLCGHHPEPIMDSLPKAWDKRCSMCVGPYVQVKSIEFSSFLFRERPKPRPMPSASSMPGATSVGFRQRLRTLWCVGATWSKEQQLRWTDMMLLSRFANLDGAGLATNP
jgi:hypothetical protein